MAGLSAVKGYTCVHGRMERGDCGESSQSQASSSVFGSALSSDDESDDTDKEPSSKKKKLTAATRKYSGSAVYSTSYQPHWERKYDFVARSNLKSHFYCKVCRKAVSIKHQGALDIERHSEGKTHRQRISSARSQTQLSFKSASHPMHEQVTAAEVRNTVMLAHHNAALCLADHIGPMQCKNFPDSEIAKNYHCARTKTACILNYALAPHLIDELVTAMKLHPYSLSVDASNDTGLSKMNPLTVRIFDISQKIVAQKFLDLCLTRGVDSSKPAEIFDAIQNSLERYGIPWDNCIAFGVDNTNSNIGAKNSIKSRVTALNPSIYFVGCPCHIVHNAAQQATEVLGEMSGVDIEGCCVDHYYWFDKSTKRKGQLEQYSTFCDTAYRGFIKHFNVRWLSLQNAVERVLQMYAASSS